MKNLLSCAACLLVIFMACRNTTTTPAKPDLFEHPNAVTPERLEGNWIAREYISKARDLGSVVKEMNNEGLPYAFAFAFIPQKKDTVICYNSLKLWLLPYTFKNDSTLEITVADGKKLFMQFDFHSHEMMLFDATHADTRMSHYVQTRDKTVNGYSAFATALNHNLFGGTYKVLGKNTPAAFAPTGEVMGLGDYTEYQVCPGGECLLAGNGVDVLFLNNPKTQQGAWFAYRFSIQKDSLILYNLKNEKPGQKWGYKVLEPAFKLLHTASTKN